MPFTKGHPFYKGGEKGWFKKGEPNGLIGIKLSKKHKEKLRQAKLKNPVRYWLGKKRPMPEEVKIKIKNSLVGKFLENNNWSWKGEDVGYSGLHKWVYKKLGKYPKNCLMCGTSGKKVGRNWNIHWANKSGKYLRKINDWISLCKKCHFEYDGINEKLNPKLVKENETE